jgi:hypothetical protein
MGVGTVVLVSAYQMPCLDCKVDTGLDGIAEYFHVHEKVWNTALGQPDAPTDRFVPGLSDAGFLCIECLERRLGRELNASDFSDAPINDPIQFYWMFGRNPSPRLIARFGRLYGKTIITVEERAISRPAHDPHDGDAT